MCRVLVHRSPLSVSSSETSWQPRTRKVYLTLTTSHCGTREPQSRSREPSSTLFRSAQVERNLFAPQSQASHDDSRLLDWPLFIYEPIVDWITLGPPCTKHHCNSQVYLRARLSLGTLNYHKIEPVLDRFQSCLACSIINKELNICQLRVGCYLSTGLGVYS